MPKLLLLCVFLVLAGCTPAAVASPIPLEPTPHAEVSPSATSSVGELYGRSALRTYDETPRPTPHTPRPTPHTPRPDPPDPFLEAQAAAMRADQRDLLADHAGWDRYDLTLALNPDNLTTTGSLALTFTNRSAETLEQIVFHLYPNHPDFGGRLDVTGARINGVGVSSGTEQVDTLFYLNLAEPLPPGASAFIELEFRTRTPRNASARIFGAHNFEAGAWNMATIYPVLARYLLDTGWDRRPITSRGDFTVTSTALYRATIDLPTDWTLVTTGVQTGVEAVNAQVRRETVVSGPQREFFLAVLRGLDQASAEVDGTRIVTYFQPRHAAAGRRSLEVAEAALRIFNERFGAYPFAEMELVEAALTQFLGMEYPGVMLIEQNLYGNNGRGLTTTVVHEIAHQWWYSQVGNDAQAEPWLDEGAATYAQVLYFEALGRTGDAETELNTYRNIYRDARARGQDAPLATPPADLRGRYFPIIYAKAGLFFHALRAEIGEAAFERFLKDYYAANRFRDVSGAQLLEAAQAACECDLTQFYTDWVLTAAPVPIP
jgi:aminopeptidase N